MISSYRPVDKHKCSLFSPSNRLLPANITYLWSLMEFPSTIRKMPGLGRFLCTQHTILQGSNLILQLRMPSSSWRGTPCKLLMKSASLSIFSAQSLQLLLLFHLLFCSTFPFENRKAGRPEPLAGIFSNKAQLHLWYHCFLGEGRGWKRLLIYLHPFCLWHPPD